MNVVALIQARMSSTRLPGKVLLPIGDLPAIVHTYRRVKSVVDQTFVLMANHATNIPLERCCDNHDMSSLSSPSDYRDDVLGRYHWAAEGVDADWIVRITGDCPFIDPLNLSVVVSHTIDTDLAFGSNIIVRHLPRGLDVEVMSRDCLNRLHENVTDPTDREHVTRYLYTHGRFTMDTNQFGRDDNFSHLRWTLDTPKDYEFFQTVAKAMDTTPPHPTASELMDYLNAHPEVKELCRETSITK